jgi:hypothetical protein
VRGVGEFLSIFLIGILIFLLLRSPCKILEPYTNPSWGFRYGVRKRAVIFPEERGYIPRRLRLYFCNENSGLPKLLRWWHELRLDQLYTAGANCAPVLCLVFIIGFLLNYIICGHFYLGLVYQSYIIYTLYSVAPT